MPRHPLTGAPTLDDVDDFFSIKPIISTSGARTAPSHQVTKPEAKIDRIRGRPIDEYGNVITADAISRQKQAQQPSYQM